MVTVRSSGVLPGRGRLCHSGILLLGGLAWGAWAPGAVAQTATLSGRVTEEESGTPVEGARILLAGSTFQSVTDAAGTFRLGDVPAGRHTLRVSHIAFGDLSALVELAPGDVAETHLRIRPGVITLASLEVTASPVAGREFRASGYRRNVVSRADLDREQGLNLTLGDVLGRSVPGVRVRRVEGVVGSPTCIELRGVGSISGRCRSPVVYLDGSPITNPMQLYATLPMEMVESIEVVPAAEAGARFGVGALHGALLLVSRRPGRPGVIDPVPTIQPPRFHDWSQEAQGHATLRTFGSAVLGNAVGLVGGVAIAGNCIGTVAPAHDRLVSTCSRGLSTLGAGAAAFVLPALGSGVGSVLGGQTLESRGRLMASAAAALMGLAPGYALSLAGRRMDSDVLRGVGAATLLLAPPLVSVVTDHQFRRGRAPIR